MAITAAKLYVEVNADTRKATDDLAKFEAKIKAFERIGEAFTSAGKKMTVGLTLPIAAAGVASIKLASDLTESMNKVDVVFGRAAASVQEFSKTAASSMGMSRQAALEATGTFGNLFTSMGLGIDQSAEMSMGLVQLASDLASFNNIDPAIALEKLRAGLVGEVEPLRTLGVNLSAAAVQAQVLAMGLAKTTEEITPAMQAQARYAIILEQTKNAQGDYARTSDGLANSTRSLKAEVADLSAEFGSALLPYAKDAVVTIRNMVGAFAAMPPETQKMIVGLAGIVAIGGPTLTVIGKLITGFTGLMTAIKLGGAGLAIAGGPITLIIAGVAALGTSIYLATQEWKEWKRVTGGTGRTAEQTMASLAGVTEELENTNLKLHEDAEAWARVEANATQAQAAMDESARVAEEAAARMAEAVAGAAEAALQAGLSGVLTEANEAYALSIADLADEHAALTLEIQNLIDAGYNPAGQKVVELTEKLRNNEAAQAAAAEAMKLATAEMIYQQAAAGLDASAALTLARSMGLISEADYTVASSIQNLKLQYDAMDGSLDGVIGNQAAFTGEVFAFYQAAQQVTGAGLPLTLENIKTALDNLSTVDVSSDDLLPDSESWNQANIDVETYKASTTTAFTEISTAATNELAAVKTAFTSADLQGTGSTAGGEIVTGFKSGIGGGATKGEGKGGGIIAANNDAILAIKKLWKDAQWPGVGLAMIQGIADGVTSNTGILTKAIQAAIAAALKAAKDAADIQSPSKLFANMVGKPIVEGMAYGILQAAPLPAAAMQSVVTTTANSYDQRTITIAPVVSNQMDVYTMLDEIKIALRSEA